jgi:predicted enzyme related to lactoylglutathione lyase
MKRRSFMLAVASGTVVAGLGGSRRCMATANLNQPVLELRVALTTAAFDQLASFYRVGLGLEPSQQWPSDQGRALVFDMGATTLEIFDEKKAQTIDQIEVGRQVSSQIRFALQVPDLDAAMKRLAANGATIVRSPVVTPWGNRTVRFQDPGGMQITLYQKPDYI